MATIKTVETLRAGDVVSFSGSGSVLYTVTGIMLDGGAVRLSVRDNCGRELTACYYVGEKVAVGPNAGEMIAAYRKRMGI